MAPTLDVFVVSPDHVPHTERSRFYRISQGLPTLLASNLECFQRVPPLVTLVFKAFVVTRQLGRFGVTGFLAL